MENDFSELDFGDLENEIQNWKLIRNASQETIDWYAMAGATCFAWFSRNSFDQKIFAAKQFISTFYTDDVIEKFSSNRQFNSAADGLLNNLGLVFSQQSDHVTDMRKFQGRNNIPDSYIEKAIETIRIQKELMRSAKQILKPKIYDFFVLGCLHYLAGVMAEKELFQQHCPSKTVISEREVKLSRDRSVGFIWILPTMMTDEATPVHLNHRNPVVDLGVSIVTLENDIVGYFRDKYVDFSPMTYFKSNSSEESDLAAARRLVDRVNRMKKMFLNAWESVPTENAKHYDYLAKYVGFTTSFCFVLGAQRANFRYGWIPQLD